MPYWYYDKEALSKTPSIQDGISYKTECRYRKEGARFIIDMGSQMDLGHNTVATGVVYFHRFYMFHSFKSFPRYVTACCCLFLAGKVEETPKKCKDIIKVAKAMLNERIFETFGEDPKEEVMTLEKILLQTMKFDLQVQHPYSYLIKYAKCFEGDKNKLQKMVQMAWTFINDSLCTTLSIQWEPEIIAIALTYLATKLSKFEILNWAHRQRHHVRWWDVFVKDLKMETLEDICHQVLDLYSPLEEEPDSPPVQTLEQHVQQPTQLTVKNELFDTPPVKDGTSQLSIKSEPLDVQFSIENGPFNTQLSIENEPFSRKLSIKNEPITSKLSNKNESLTQLCVKNEPFTQLGVKNESLTQLSVKNEPFTQLSVKNESLTQLSVKNEPFAEQADTKWSVKTEPMQPKESAINHTSTISPRDPRLHGHSTPLNEDFHNQRTASCTSMSSSSSTVSPGYTVFSPSFTIPNFSVPPPNFKPTKDNNFPSITKGFGAVNTFETLKGAKILSNAQKKKK